MGCWVKWLVVKRDADPQGSCWQREEGYLSSALWLVLCVYSLIGSSEQSYEVGIVMHSIWLRTESQRGQRTHPELHSQQEIEFKARLSRSKPQFFLQYLSAPEVPPGPDSSGCCRTSSWPLFIRRESLDEELKQWRERDFIRWQGWRRGKEISSEAQIAPGVPKSAFIFCCSFLGSILNQGTVLRDWHTIYWESRGPLDVSWRTCLLASWT